MLKRYTIKIISLFALLILAPVALLVLIGKSSKVDVVANDYKAYADTPSGSDPIIGGCEGGSGGCCN